MEEGCSERVAVYVYDITQGMARSFSPMLLGRVIEGVWHTGLVVGEGSSAVEYFFGFGVQRCSAGRSPFGAPLRVLELGSSQLGPALREELLGELSARFQPQHYHLLHHNCNHFTHEAAQLLVGEGIPESILRQHEELLATPLGQMLAPMLSAMERQMGSATAEGFGATASAGGGGFGAAAAAGSSGFGAAATGLGGSRAAGFGSTPQAAASAADRAAEAAAAAAFGSYADERGTASTGTRAGATGTSGAPGGGSTPDTQGQHTETGEPQS